jgi:hypothetical protein
LQELFGLSMGVSRIVHLGRTIHGIGTDCRFCCKIRSIRKAGTDCLWDQVELSVAARQSCLSSLHRELCFRFGLC